MNKKNLLAVVAGFATSFILGWLVYDVILKNFYQANSMAGLNKPEDQVIMWAIVMGALTGVLLMNYVLGLAGADTFMKGATTGLIVSVLMAASYDFYFYAATNMISKSEVICVDVLSSGVQGAIIGGVIGMVRGMAGKPAAAAA